MTKILAIDPGPEESALLTFNLELGVPVRWAKVPNREALQVVWNAVDCDECYVEMVASYGMAVGASVFETCVWIGRFIERWEMLEESRAPATLMFRRTVKQAICHDSRAKDANIRWALIDRYGGKEAAVGRKADPGPLYGISGDCWSALAIAVTVADQAGVLAA